MTDDALRRTQAFLLAAGRGRRAGGPKAWRDLDGKPAVRRHVEHVVEMSVGVTIAVQRAWLVRCEPKTLAARWLPVNPDLPPLASLQRLIAERASDEPGFVYHVDMPLFEREVFSALAESRDDAEAWVPSFEGRRGHPVLLSPELFPLVLALDPKKDRLDEFLRSRRVAEVPVRQPSVLENLNRPGPAPEME